MFGRKKGLFSLLKRGPVARVFSKGAKFFGLRAFKRMKRPRLTKETPPWGKLGKDPPLCLHREKPFLAGREISPGELTGAL